jgi:amino-acid N-acetyltransferase
MMSEPIVTGARPDERAAMADLLARCALPVDGLDDCGHELFVARAGGGIVAGAGLDVRGAAALLRSVAVAPTHRGLGLGERVTAHALARADQLGLDAVYLLTTTAEQFFPRFGFVRIERSEVPPDIRGSVEFTSACPASAIVMRRRRPSASPA